MEYAPLTMRAALRRRLTDQLLRSMSDVHHPDETDFISLGRIVDREEDAVDPISAPDEQSSHVTIKDIGLLRDGTPSRHLTH
jgi:hypothetical protein